MRLFAFVLVFGLVTPAFAANERSQRAAAAYWQQQHRRALAYYWAEQQRRQLLNHHTRRMLDLYDRNQTGRQLWQDRQWFRVQPDGTYIRTPGGGWYRQTPNR